MAFMLRVVLTVIVFAALTGCNSVSDPAQGDYAETVRTTITGRVVDEEGKSVQGAVVSGHGTSTTTNGTTVPTRPTPPARLHGRMNITPPDGWMPE